jgi:hypothetical protein
MTLEKEGKMGKPKKQRCTQEIQDHSGQRYDYETMAAGNTAQKGTGSVI